MSHSALYLRLHTLEDCVKMKTLNISRLKRCFRLQQLQGMQQSSQGLILRRTGSQARNTWAMTESLCDSIALILQKSRLCFI